MSMKCAEHGKARNVNYLMEIGNGEYTCKPENRCKVPQATPPAAAAPFATAYTGGATAYTGGAAAAYGGGAGGQLNAAYSGNYYPGYRLPEAGAAIHQSVPPVNQPPPPESLPPQQQVATPSSTAELLAQGHAIINPEKAEVCHAHGKMRNPQQLYQVMTPTGPKWECLLETRCKTSSVEQLYDGSGAKGAPMGAGAAYGQRYSPYGMPIGGNGAMIGRPAGGGMRPAGGFAVGGYVGAPNEYCYLHGKKRSAAALEMQMDGTYQCKPSSACKTKAAEVGSTAICTVHKKSRKIEYLIADATGGYSCAPQYACQGGPQ